MPVLIERTVSFQWFWVPLVRHALGVAPTTADAMPYWVPLLHPNDPDYYMRVVTAYKNDFHKRGIVKSNTKAWAQVWEPARQKKDRRTKCRVFRPQPFYQLRNGYMSLVNPAARRVVDHLGRCGLGQDFFDDLCTRIVLLHARIAASVPAAHPVGDTLGSAQPLPRPNPLGTTMEMDEDTAVSDDHDFPDYDGFPLMDGDYDFAMDLPQDGEFYCDTPQSPIDSCDGSLVDGDWEYDDSECPHDGYDNSQSPGDVLPGSDEPLHILSPLIDFDVDLELETGAATGNSEDSRAALDVELDIDLDIDLQLDTGAATGESEHNSAPLDLELDTESIAALDSFDDDACRSATVDPTLNADPGDLDCTVGLHDRVIESIEDLL